MKPQEKLISLPINFWISHENHNDNILYIVKAGMNIVRIYFIYHFNFAKRNLNLKEINESIFHI